MTKKTTKTASKKPTASVKTAKVKTNPNAKEYHFMTSILDILELNEIKFEPQENWRLVSEIHKLNEPFTTGLLGKTGFSLLEIINKIYSRKAAELPPVKKIDKKKKEEYLVPFWDENIFLNSISIDAENKVVELDFDK